MEDRELTTLFKPDDHAGIGLLVAASTTERSPRRFTSRRDRGPSGDPPYPYLAITVEAERPPETPLVRHDCGCVAVRVRFPPDGRQESLTLSPCRMHADRLGNFPGPVGDYSPLSTTEACGFAARLSHDRAQAEKFETLRRLLK